MVGESPTKGIQNVAFRNALTEIEKINENTSVNEVSILGPSYSGSIQSLGNAIGQWVNEYSPSKRNENQFKFYSGTATGKKNKEALKQFGNIENIKAIFSYQSFATGDDKKTKQITLFLQEKYGISEKEIVYLVENTTFGSNVSEVASESYQPNENKITNRSAASQNINKVKSFPFPLHIAQIQVDRMAKNNQNSDYDRSEKSQTKKFLRLEFDSTSQKSDIPLPYAPKMSSRTGELVIGEIMQSIKQSGAKAIGIVATDVRDQLFLVNEIKRKMPNVLVFTYEGDVLLAHPYYRKATRGLLVASSNRLEFNDANTQSARIFSSDRAIGVFVAFSHALKTPKIEEDSNKEKNSDVVITSPSNSGLWVLKATKQKDNGDVSYIPSIWKVIFLFLIVATAYYTWNLRNRPKHHYNFAENERTLISNKQKSIRLKLYLSLAMIPFSISLLIMNKSDDAMSIVIGSYWISQGLAIIYSNVSYFRESWNIHVTSHSDSNWFFRYRKILTGIIMVISKSVLSLIVFWILLVFTIFYSGDIIESITYDNYIRLLSLNSGVSPLLPILLFSSVLTYYYSVRLSDYKLQSETIYFSQTKMENITPVILLKKYVNFSTRVLTLMIPIVVVFIAIPIYYIYNEYLGDSVNLFGTNWDELPMPLAMFEVAKVTFWVNIIFVFALFLLVAMSIKYMSNYDRLMQFINSVRRFIHIEKEKKEADESGFFEKVFAEHTPFMLGLINYTSKDKEDMARWDDFKRDQGNIEILYKNLDEKRSSEELIESFREFRLSNAVEAGIASLTTLYCTKIKEQLIIMKADKRTSDKECKELSDLVDQLSQKREALSLELYILFTSDNFEVPKHAENGLLLFVKSLTLNDQKCFSKDFFSSANINSVNSFYSFLTTYNDPSNRIYKIIQLVKSIQNREVSLAQKVIEHAQNNDFKSLFDFREECRNAFKICTIEWLKLFIPVLRRQLSFIIYSSMAILLGIMSYPFYPSQFLLTWVGGIVVLIAVLSANSIVQMDRNYVLSALFTKSHGKVGINKSFANGIAKYSAAPISMVFLSQSEWLQNAIGDFLGPILNSIFS